MDPEQRKRLEALNTDHHRRMSTMLDGAMRDPTAEADEVTPTVCDDTEGLALRQG